MSYFSDFVKNKWIIEVMVDLVDPVDQVGQ